MTREEYENYQQSVAEFFVEEGLNNLSSDNDEPYFSWNACDCCGTHLGGNRYDCSGYCEETGEVQDGYCVCEDCVYYAEYGQLDDDTMWQIEHDNTPVKGKADE